jgi:dTDP-4-amino-4,6-dideoxygalactose transaminase
MKSDDQAPPFLPFHRPTIYAHHIEAVVSALKSGWLSSARKVEEFERAFALTVGAKHAVAVNSCTAALHLSLLCLKVGPGDEVITSPITFVSAVSVIEHVGATPVFVDVLPRDLTIDPDLVRKAITGKTKAIIATHFAGFPAHMAELEKVAGEYGIPLITDAAHAIETSYRGRLSGQLGLISCYSFYPTKNITTGEGGMLTTDDDEISEKARSLRMHGVTKSAWDRYGPGGYKHWDVVDLGWKYNMSDIQAALGMAQLMDMPAWLKQREKLDLAYRASLAGEIHALTQPDGEMQCSRHLFVIRLSFRDRIMWEIQKRGIGVGVHFRAVYRLKYYEDRYHVPMDKYPESELASEEVLSLPLYPTMSTSDVEWVVQTLRDVIYDVQHNLC